jgi:hypothetical protein
MSDTHPTLDNLIGTSPGKVTFFPFFLGPMRDTYPPLLGMVGTWYPVLANMSAGINVFLGTVCKTIPALVGLIDTSALYGTSLRGGAMCDTYPPLDGLVRTSTLEGT